MNKHSNDFLHEYESRVDRPELKKVSEFMKCERLLHVIFSKQFNKELLGHLGTVANQTREIAQIKDGYVYLNNLLNHKRGMLYFTQASTRTFLSFQAALQILGITCSNIRDSRVSSEYKGESPLDSIRMFSSYFDIIIMRSVIPNFAESCAYLMNDLSDFNQRNVPIVNGGAGADEHPTQALLDIYTIQKEFSFTSKKDSSKWSFFEEMVDKYPNLTKGLSNKTYCFCGDIGRGRTVRSLVNLLSLYENNTFYFVSPDNPKLKISQKLKSELQKNHKVFEVDDLNDVINEIDMLYMTRIQHEHDSEEDSKFYKKLDFSKYRLTKEKVEKMRDYAIILHPFPRNEEIPPEVDIDKRAKYFEQARNGMWIRAALVAYLFDVDSKITRYYNDNYSDYHDYNVSVL